MKNIIRHVWGVVSVFRLNGLDIVTAVCGTFAGAAESLGQRGVVTGSDLACAMRRCGPLCHDDCGHSTSLAYMRFIGTFKC